MTTTRQAFATFIERLIANKSQGNDWNALAANHYDDEMLEVVRRDVVRLMIDNTDSTGRIAPDSESDVINQLRVLKKKLEK